MKGLEWKCPCSKIPKQFHNHNEMRGEMVLLRPWKQLPHVAVCSIFINYKGICKISFFPSTHSLSIIYAPGAMWEAGVQRWIRHSLPGRAHNRGRQLLLLFIIMWLCFPCPVPTSSPRNLDFNSQRTILWGEKKGNDHSKSCKGGRSL